MGRKLVLTVDYDNCKIQAESIMEQLRNLAGINKVTGIVDCEVKKH